MNKTAGQIGRLFVNVSLLSVLAISIAQAKTVYPDNLVTDNGNAAATSTPDASIDVFSQQQVSRDSRAENERGAGSSALSTSAEVGHVAERSGFAVHTDGIVIGVAAITPTPEPASMLLMAGGLAALGWKLRKRVRA
jgi:hypothetical protein